MRYEPVYIAQVSGWRPQAQVQPVGVYDIREKIFVEVDKIISKIDQFDRIDTSSKCLVQK